MKIAVIADDLTGANDTGVQLAKKGVDTFVILKPDPGEANDGEAFVFDTDSRSLPRNDAYRRVLQAAEIVRRFGFDIVYKKLDSTLRGNVGAEIDAVYDAVSPDFVVIAPSFPALGRTVADGVMRVNGRLLHETDVARDPKTPVKESYIPRLLVSQSSRNVGLITGRELNAGTEAVLRKISDFRMQGVPYLLFDAETDDDLSRIVEAVGLSGYRVVWAGSAGLASRILGPAAAGRPMALPPASKPILTVVGSVHGKSREQLAALLAMPDVAGVRLASECAAADEAMRNREISRVVDEASRSISIGKHIALYSAGELDDIARAVEQGQLFGMDRNSVSESVAQALGLAAAELIRRFQIDRLVLTGGDTARQVCGLLNASCCKIFDEIEAGVPVGYLQGTGIYIVTKAGGFGTEAVLTKALRMLERGSL